MVCVCVCTHVGCVMQVWEQTVHAYCSFSSILSSSLPFLSDGFLDRLKYVQPDLSLYLGNRSKHFKGKAS